jgi:hypothetical protein
MLFDVAADPHEQVDLAPGAPQVVADARARLATWTAAQLERTGLEDPLEVVRREGGPFHVRRHLPAYLERLRSTGRSHWADVLADRHPDEVAGTR